MTSNQPIAVLTAIPEEIAAFGAHLVETGRETVAGISIHHGTLDGRAVVLAESGIGKVNGALAATVLFDRFRCGGIIFSGVAGGLDPDLAVGDLVIATEVIQHDYGAMVQGALEVYRAGALPFPQFRGELSLKANPALIATARTALTGARFGTILTGAPISAAAGRGSGCSPALAARPSTWKAARSRRWPRRSAYLG
jgi:adenosylhomocysteine nucleosidase